jgi:predicted ATPase with chaperone activity
MIKTAMRPLGLSTRACHRVLKPVRTGADLAGNERIEVQHPAEGEGVER